jgi:hypothetical protein
MSSVLKHNCAFGFGGAISVNGVDVLVTNTSLSRNFGVFGGAVSVEDAALYGLDCVFDTNIAAMLGGATIISDSTSYSNASVFIGNHAVIAGGGVAVRAGTMFITDTTMQRNYGGMCGGGIFLHCEKPHSQARASVAVVNSSLFSSNSAGGGAGLCANNVYSKIQTSASSYGLPKLTSGYVNNKPGVPSHFAATAWITNSTFINSTPEQGWGRDVFLIDNTTVVFGPGVNLHRQSDSVLWRRNCTVGEVSTGDGTCTACPALSYSLLAVGSCSPCKASALCLGGALIAPAAGFWHAFGGNETKFWGSCSLDKIIRSASGALVCEKQSGRLPQLIVLTCP